MKAFADWLRAARMERGLTQKDLCDALGYANSVVCVWEAGRHEPRDRALVALGRFFDRPVGEIAELVGPLGHETLGERIRDARWALSLTQDELAERIGVGRETVVCWEADRQEPGRSAEQLETVLGVTFCGRTPRGGPISWAGSKTTFAPQILPLLPDGEVYVEPFGGAGSVLFARHPSPTEVWNDLNGDLANLFRVLRDEEGALRLRDQLVLTMYSRAEYRQAAAWLDDPHTKPVERAWAFYVLMNQAFHGRQCHLASNWRPHPDAVTSWWRRVEWLGWWHERLANVLIENEPAGAVIARYDSPKTVFYVDPPYVRRARKTAGALYRHELTAGDHQALVAQLLKVKGSVVVSGYPHPIYERLEARGWRRIHLGGDEIVWQNRRAQRLAPA